MRSFSFTLFDNVNTTLATLNILRRDVRNAGYQDEFVPSTFVLTILKSSSFHKKQIQQASKQTSKSSE